MKIYQGIVIGSSEWIDLDSASEAPAKLGLSSYTSRTELLTFKKTGIAKEVDSFTQARFDKGHAVEALARPIVEKLIDDDLYPVSGSIKIDGLELYASFDGLTMSEDVVFEHKLINSRLKQYLASDNIPEEYMPQLEQQLLVSGAEKAIFVASDGTEENMFYAWYKSNPELRQKIIDGWKQFNKDLKTFKVPKTEVKPEAKPLMELPALSISIMGEVSSSNLEVYKSTALQFIQNINTDLQTDQDFVDAENTIKFCDRAEKELESVKKQALAHTSDIDTLFKTVDHLKEELRLKRLTLNKQVKDQKEAIKYKIVQDSQLALADHILELNKELDGLSIPSISENFVMVIKGKRNISSMHDALNTELARVKIKTDSIAKTIRQNINYLLDKHNHRYDALFMDIQSIVTKQPEDFMNLVDSRISQHKQDEKKRLEAERGKIRIEEQRKAEQEAQIKLNDERKAIQEKERKKAQEEKRIQAENIENAKEINKIALECAEASKIESVTEQLNPVLVEPTEETITISMAEYNKLIKESQFLDALIAAGVDNWIGYDSAQEILEEQAA